MFHGQVSIEILFDPRNRSRLAGLVGASILLWPWAFAPGQVPLSRPLQETPLPQAAPLGTVIFVALNASGANDGTSWANAYKDLQDALTAAAQSPGLDEVWVAAGTYRPDQGVAITPGDRTATFQLINGVAIYGGFAGNETMLSQRDVAANLTILSGDLSGNDSPVGCVQDMPDCISFGGRCVDGLCILKSSMSENAFHVVTGSGTNASAAIDGFTITGGFADGIGDDADGGGMYVFNGGLSVTDCTFSGNWAADTSGGMLIGDGSTPVLNQCTFFGNASGFSGGGVVIKNASDPVIMSCTLTNNTAEIDGGAFVLNGASVMILNSTFSRNSANGVSGSGGAIYISSGQCLVDGSVFSQNHARGHGGAIGQRISANIQMTVSDSVFDSNDADGVNGGGAIALYSSGSTTIESSTFIDNHAFADGGAIKVNSSLNLLNSRFLGNTAHFGGALLNTSTICAVNCIFSGNEANQIGGGIYQTAGDMAVVNCTFAGNAALTSVGGGIGTNGGVLDVDNSVFWGNMDSSGTTENAQLFPGGGSFDVDYSLIQGLSTWTDPMNYVGNVDGNPLFVDANGPDNIVGTIDDDLRLQPGSPAIDAANTPALPMDVADLDGDANVTERIPFDLAGHARVFDDPSTVDTGVPGSPVADMGAYEFLGIDCNQNGIPDPCDISCGAANGPCDVPGCGGSVDVDMNGVPDDCGYFGGGCPMMSMDWSCFDNWELPGNVYPDNTPMESYHVTLDQSDDVFLDVDVIINSLRLLDDSILRVTQSGMQGDMTIVTDLGLHNEGTILMGAGRLIELSCGPVTVINGYYGPDPTAPPGTVNGALNCETLRIAQPNGEALLAHSMSLNASVDVIVDGRGATPCTNDGGKTTPIMNVRQNAIILVGGNFVLDSNTNFTNASAQNMNVGGNFFNTGNFGDCFDCSQGGLTMSGSGPQTFEVSGQDFGVSLSGFNHPDGHTNFSWENMEITGGATHLVRFQNSATNTVGSGECQEALYVRNLTLREGATIVVDNAKVYYLNLVDEGATIIPNGCGALVPIAIPCVTNPQCNDLLVCTYDDCHMGFCRFTPVVYGNVNGAGPVNPNLDDILCVLAGFANATSCPGADIRGAAGSPCVPNGSINLDDILAVLAAFGGIDPCGCAP